MGIRTSPKIPELLAKHPRRHPKTPQDTPKTSPRNFQTHTQDDPQTISIPSTTQDGHKTPKRHLLSSSWRQLRAILAPTCTILGPFWPPQIASQDGVQHKAILGSILGWFLRGGWGVKTYKNLVETLLFWSGKNLSRAKNGKRVKKQTVRHVLKRHWVNSLNPHQHAEFALAEAF